MEYYRSDPESTDQMWRAECAAVDRFCQGLGIDPGAGNRTLDQTVRCFDVNPKEPHIEKAEATQLPLNDDSYDFVFNAHLLEHLPDPRAAICEWLRVVKPGGHVAMVIPNTIFTGGQNTDATVHLFEWSPREFVKEVLGIALKAEEVWTAPVGAKLEWCDGIIAHLSPACERWSFAVVLQKAGGAQ